MGTKQDLKKSWTLTILQTHVSLDGRGRRDGARSRFLFEFGRINCIEQYGSLTC